MIEVKNLTKRYGSHLALDNINFTVNKGEVVGFLGPNGAGKTTTMNIITGFLSATEGEVTINGANILDEPEKAKANIGYLPDTPPLYGDMLVDEYLDFVCDLKGVKKSERVEMLKNIKSTVRISEMGKRLVKNLSKGYRQRLGLAQAMVGYPNVLILDEPTVGLDPKQIIEMRDVIRDLSRKHTVILSSHILPEVSAVCDKVIIINKGKIVAIDTTEHLSTTLSQGHAIKLRVKGNESDIKAALKSTSVIKTVDTLGSREKGTFDFTVHGKEEVDIRESIFNVLAEKKLPILEMKGSDLSLEEIFLQIISGNSTFGEANVLTDASSEVVSEVVSEVTEISEDNRQNSVSDDVDNLDKGGQE